jgi:integrase
MTALVPITAHVFAFAEWPPAISAAPPDALHAVLQFFAAEVRNPHTRRAYIHAAQDFFRHATMLPAGNRLETLTSLHVSSWVEAMLRDGRSPPTVKLRLAGVRVLLQALVRERVIAINPAAVVRGPKHSARRGKTPVLSADEARQLLDAIDVSTLAGLRDRALIATMIYTFARISAVTAMTVEDVFTQQRRLWLRLHEKGGKRHDVPCHHALEGDLSAYMDAVSLRGMPRAPLFQTLSRDHGRPPRLSGKPLTQSLVWDMVQRRMRDARLLTHACNHTFRACLYA